MQWLSLQRHRLQGTETTCETDVLIIPHFMWLLRTYSFNSHKYVCSSCKTVTGEILWPVFSVITTLPLKRWDRRKGQKALKFFWVGRQDAVAVACLPHWEKHYKKLNKSSSSPPEIFCTDIWQKRSDMRAKKS